MSCMYNFQEAMHRSSAGQGGRSKAAHRLDAPTERSGWRIGIVIPCKGDQTLLPQCLLSLEEFRVAGDRIVVVDGDGIADLAANMRLRDVHYLHAADSRRGAAIDCGIVWLLQNENVDILMICHADMRVASGTRAAMFRSMVANARFRWGWMGHRIDDRRWRYRVVERGNDWRGMILHLPYGDQLMFVGVDLLAQIGGWPSQPNMEDIELSLRLRKITPPMRVNAPALISGRHWRHGIMKTTFRNWLTAVRYANNRKPKEEGACLLTRS